MRLNQGREITLRSAAFRCAPFFICTLTALLLCAFSSDEVAWSLHLLTAPLLLALLLCLLTFALPKALRITLQILFGEAILLVCLVECYCQSEFISQITPRILSLIVNTDSREAGEFFSTYISAKMLRNWSLDLVLLMILLLPISYIFENRIYKKLVNSNVPLTPLSLPPHSPLIPRIILPVLFLALLAYEIPSNVRFLRAVNPHSTQQESEMQMFNGIDDDLTTPLHRLAFSWLVMKQSKETITAIHRSCEEARISGCSYRSPHIVLVIGESYNKHHSQLYGYQLPTTPNQMKRRDNGELFPFSDAVAPWNITNNVMMSIFSLWDNSCSDELGNYPMLPILFRRAGYEVCFVTNQFQMRGLLRGFSNKAGNFFLTDVALSDSLFTFRNKRKSTFDMGLVNAFRTHLDTCQHNDVSTTYSLDIIHLMGQHFEYNKRYPDDKALFTLTDYAGRSISDEGKTTVMHYDNATLYNDLVMDSIIQMYEDMEAIVIYLSDHGDEVWDDDTTHTRTFQTPGAIAAHNEYEVPFWIWCSESYRAAHPDIVEQIKAAIDRPFLTDDLPQLLLYLAGIESRWNRPERNILSPSYTPKPRLIDGSTNYDKVVYSTE